jgi:hypothetical protein
MGVTDAVDVAGRYLLARGDATAVPEQDSRRAVVPVYRQSHVTGRAALGRGLLLA